MRLGSEMEEAGSALQDIPDTRTAYEKKWDEQVDCPFPENSTPWLPSSPSIRTILNTTGASARGLIGRSADIWCLEMRAEAIFRCRWSSA